MEFTLRPATVEDIEFIFALRVKTMKPFFEDTLGWNDAKEYEKAADELTNSEIVMVGQKRTGVIKVIPRTDELHLHQMQILPEFQKQGIGAELVRLAVDRSEQSRKPITLFVVKNSPAKRLYEQYGFEVTSEFEYNFRMCRQPRIDQDRRRRHSHKKTLCQANSADAKSRAADLQQHRKK